MESIVAKLQAWIWDAKLEVAFWSSGVEIAIATGLFCKRLYTWYCEILLVREEEGRWEEILRLDWNGLRPVWIRMDT